MTPAEHLIVLKNIRDILRTLYGLPPSKREQVVSRLVGEIETILVYHERMTVSAADRLQANG